MKEIIGIVEKIKSNRKSLTILNKWYNSFILLPEELEEGDKVKIIFSEKEVDDKIFNNIKSVELIEQTEDIEETKSEKSIEVKPLRDSTTINNLVMCSKDVFVASKGDITLKQATTDVIASYKQIVNNISK